MSLFGELKSISNHNVVKSTLLKIQHSNSNVSKTRLQNYWIRHGENVAKYDLEKSVLFFEAALRLGSSIKVNTILDEISSSKFEKSVASEIKSINESDEIHFNELKLNNRFVIAIDIEEAKFEKLTITKEKELALSIMRMDLPDWYDKNKGHTNIGYAYADLARELVKKKPIEKRSINSLIIFDYVSSLAIFDDSISRNVCAKLFKFKGDVALRIDDKEKAIIFFEQALAYNDAVGVKKLLTKLKKEVS
jgi:hypothetical protein